MSKSLWVWYDWGREAPVAYIPFSFNKDQRGDLGHTLKKSLKTAKEREKFIKALEEAASKFLTLLKIEEGEHLPNKQRLSFEKMKKNADELVSFLENASIPVDAGLNDVWHSYIIENGIEFGGYTSLRKRLLPDLKRFSSLMASAILEMPKQGIFPRSAKFGLAIWVREVLDSFNIEPTSGQNGIYCICLETILDATGSHLDEARNLARAVLKPDPPIE